MRVICVLITLIMSFSAYGQDDMSFLKKWKSYPVPTNKDTLHSYNWSMNDWFVYVENGDLKVVKRQVYCEKPESKLPFKIKQSNSNLINISAPLAGLIDALRVNDGYLVGFNRGEWGGELYWFSKKGRKKYEISKHQIVQFIKRDNKIYAIQGLSHLTRTRGSIIEIKKKRGKWVAEQYVSLSAPDAVQLDSKGNFIVVTSGTSLGYTPTSNNASELLSIDKKAKTETLVKDAMWWGLYPSSMVIQNDVVYIGMRKGVYKFNLVTKKDEWLLPE